MKHDKGSIGEGSTTSKTAIDNKTQDAATNTPSSQHSFHSFTPFFAHQVDSPYSGKSYGSVQDNSTTSQNRINQPKIQSNKLYGVINYIHIMTIETLEIFPNSESTLIIF